MQRSIKLIRHVQKRTSETCNLHYTVPSGSTKVGKWLRSKFQHICLKFGLLGYASRERVVYEAFTIFEKDLRALVDMQIEEILHSGHSPNTIYIGMQQFQELAGRNDLVPTYMRITPTGVSLYDINVIVLPHLDGVLVA